MSTPNLDKLLAVSSGPHNRQRPEFPQELLQEKRPLLGQLQEVLRHKNGFYAFECALHVFPFGPTPQQIDLERWNDPELWRGHYGALTQPEQLFFAQDIFGGSFYLDFKRTEVGTFNPETGQTQSLGRNLEDWAQGLFRDLDFLTGYPLARQWQRKHGPLAPGQRLIPKTPFAAGGPFHVDNLLAADPVESLRFRGKLAQKVRALPEGEGFPQPLRSPS